MTGSSPYATATLSWPRIMAGMIALVMFAFILMFGGRGGDDEGSVFDTPTSRDRVESLVRSYLSDQTGAVSFIHFGGGCGLVSAAEGFNERASHMPFIVSKSDAVATLRDGRSDFQALWTKHCQTRGAPALSV